MSLSKTYNPNSVEPHLQEMWLAQGINEFDRNPLGPVYSIDTPPPTVSGLLHLGHVYSYSQTDFMARFWRMNGFNVYYPMGFDDNGLPTERLVERWRKVRPADIGRQAFIVLCQEVSQQVEQDYKTLWQRLGLSVDWRFTYRTIGDLSRKTSQASFLDLYLKGLVYQKEAPSIWCPECQTAIAQAELDDLERPAEFYTLAFREEDGSTIAVATTRPELLPACVAVFVHPDDSRYQNLIGTKLQVPLFDQEVPVLADSHADPHKGTGAVMCCTFGDQVDVEWWHSYHLPLLVALGPDGRMTGLAGRFAGLPHREARVALVAAARDLGLLLETKQMTQSVRVHERCDTPVEYRVTRQWFVKVLEFKDQLLKLGAQVVWHPEHMQARYREWVENLHWDWCISRQRYYGVPFPLWYCARCGEIKVAGESSLPVDPEVDRPESPCICGSREFLPEMDVMDTWATSSMSPQTAGRWLSDPQLYARVFPFSLRPQAHEIIRTWAFYTLVKSFHHFDALPWNEIAISGWGLAPQGMGKISKSRGGGPVAPMEWLERYSADAVRYWAASSGFGRDAVINEEKVQAGARLVTKLWNVARFSECFIETYTPTDKIPPLSPADAWIMARLQGLIAQVTTLLRGYDYVAARNELEGFFWHDLADNYLEMAKQRLYDPSNTRGEGARFCLYTTLLALVKMFTPILPFVTDEIYQGLFGGHEGFLSVHLSTWPQVDERLMDETAAAQGEILVGVATAVRRYKSERNLPLGLAVDRVQLGCADPGLIRLLEEARSDLTSVTRATLIEVVSKLDGSQEAVVYGGLVSIGIQAAGEDGNG